MTLLLPLENNPANAIRLIEHKIRELQGTIDSLDRKIAHHTANIFGYEQEWQNLNQMLKRNIDVLHQERFKWIKKREASRFIDSLAESICDLQDGIYQNDDKYPKIIAFQRESILSLSIERNRVNNEKQRLESRVEHIKKNVFLRSKY